MYPCGHVGWFSDILLRFRCIRWIVQLLVVVTCELLEHLLVNILEQA